MYCMIALAVAATGTWYLLKRIRGFDLIKKNTITVSFNWSDLIPVLICLGVTTTLWIWGYNKAFPAFDEVFSAQNAAGIHPFQCISYYMLPNNHVLFNLINNVLFHPSVDKVVTGRVISLLAYSTFAVSIFFWLKQVLQNRWMALMAAITLAHQFFVWGFSFQARGYELYLLFELGMFISLFCYIRRAHHRWLFLNLLCTALGYFCLPSFLYRHVAQMLFVVLWQLVYRKKEAGFWKYQVAALVLAFIFYLPVLSFSGLESITRNNYVVPMSSGKTVGTFVTWLGAGFPPYIVHLFSDIHWQTFNINLILFFLPLLLLFAKKNKVHFLFGLFYLSLWLTFFLIVIAMKRLPFERNLICHYSLTLLGVLLLAHLISEAVKKGAMAIILKWIFFPAILAFFIVHFISTNEFFLRETLYEYDVNGMWQFKTNELAAIPAGSTVAFSETEFYSCYICRKKGCMVSKCATGNEAYYIKLVFDSLPPASAGKYVLMSTIDGNEVYKRK